MIYNAVVEKKISKKYEASLLKRLSSMRSSRCCGKFKGKQLDGGSRRRSLV